MVSSVSKCIAGKAMACVESCAETMCGLGEGSVFQYGRGPSASADELGEVGIHQVAKRPM